MSELTISKENFEQEVLKSDIPVLADFWAEWCMPCKMMEPVLEKIADKYSGKIKIAKINVDNVPELASRYNVMNIPTMLLFKGGEVVEKQIGAVAQNNLEKLIDKHL